MEKNRAEKPQVILYTTDPCRRCLRAKEVLERHGLEYREVDLAKDPSGRRKLVELTGYSTFPQITVDGRSLGGFEELQAAAEIGALDALTAD